MNVARRPGWHLPLLLIVVSLAGCATATGPGSVDDRSLASYGGTPVIRSELVFGRAKPDGSTVSDGEWRAFVDDHVTPRFPDGLTILDASGQYRTRAGQLVREPSKIIILLHPPSEGIRAAIQEIRMLYRKLFDQESVLLLTAIGRASF